MSNKSEKPAPGPIDEPDPIGEASSEPTEEEAGEDGTASTPTDGAA